MNNQFLNYEDLLEPLIKLDPNKDPSEIHGSICGIVCADNSIDKSNWAQMILPQLEPHNLTHKDSLEILKQLFSQTVLQLNDPNCEFEMLLPNEDNADTQTQVDALGEWCQGFLVGLSLGGISDLSSLPEDSAELAGDFVEIARAGTSYELDDGDNDQQSLFELIEYVRIGVLLINEELHPLKSAPLNSTSLH